MITDVVIGLQHGDEGKGKVVSTILGENLKDYSLCVRYNGGPNAGHTIYYKSKKYTLHQVPIGFVHGINSLIGSGCVIDIEKLKEEIDTILCDVERDNIHIYISSKAHIITDSHKTYDTNNNTVGTTGSGIGPCYADKMYRTGKRMCDIDRDTLDDLMYNYNIVVIENQNSMIQEFKNKKILVEGAQGYMLDIDHGEYPYVTSSTCTVGGINTAGIPIKSVNRVYGCAKIYDTYVGTKNFMPDDPDLQIIQKLGNEYGSTTGRPRQCNWLNFDKIIEAIKVNNVTDVVFNKCDVLQGVNFKVKIYFNEDIHDFNSVDDLKMFVGYYIQEYFNKKVSVYFSGNPYKFDSKDGYIFE